MMVMIVIELEEKKYGKTMEAVAKIKDYAECLAEMLEDHSMGYRRNQRMNYRKRLDDYDDYDERNSRREYDYRYM